MLKITPSHDFVDLNIARRHKEEIDDEAMNRCCIDEQGRLVNAPGFNGLDRFEARSKVCSSMLRLCVNISQVSAFSAIFIEYS